MIGMHIRMTIGGLAMDLHRVAFMRKTTQR